MKTTVLALMLALVLTPALAQEADVTTQTQIRTRANLIDPTLFDINASTDTGAELDDGDITTDVSSSAEAELVTEDSDSDTEFNNDRARNKKDRVNNKRERLAEVRAQKKERLAEFKEQRENRRAELSAKLEARYELREARDINLSLNAQSRINKASESLANNYSQALTKLENLYARIEAKLLEMEAEGLEVSSSLEIMQQARASLDEAAEASIEAEVVGEVIVSAADSRQAWQDVKENYRSAKAELKATKSLLKDAIAEARNSNASVEASAEANLETE